MSTQLVILSGPPNAGKSATAEALCQRYDRMLHIEMAVLRELLRMGRLRPHDETPEGRRQRTLFVEAACDMARRFLDAGYGVVIDDVILEDDLAAYCDGLAGVTQPVHFVVLLPGLEAVLGGEKRRREQLEELHARFAGWRGVASVDPGSLTPELVADRVMALAAEGNALLDAGATAAR